MIPCIYLHFYPIFAAIFLNSITALPYDPGIHVGLFAMYKMRLIFRNIKRTNGCVSSSAHRAIFYGKDVIFPFLEIRHSK